MKDGICIECREKLIHVKKYSLCAACYQRKYRNGEIPKPNKRIYSHNPNPKAHSRAAMEWQKRNKDKFKASHLAKQNKNIVSIIYECPCTDNGKKHWHHFDYSRPYEVLVLCHKCHRAEHKRLKRIEESYKVLFKQFSLTYCDKQKILFRKF